MSDRNVERGRGCWNCKEFITGEPVLQKYLTSMAREMIGLKELKRTLPPKARQQLRDYERAIKRKRMGCCQKNDVRELSGGEKEKGKPGDFIHFEFLCNMWSGVDGHSLATRGHALDKLPDELKEEKTD